MVKENKNIYVTELGEVVNRIMKQCFPSIVDIAFTANLEFLLDSVGEGLTPWKTIVRNFYPDLMAAVDEAQRTLETVHIADEESDEICEVCGRRMVIKYGPHGKFLAWSGIPGVPEYEAVSGEDRHPVSEVRKRSHHQEDEKRQKVLRL